MRADHTKVTTAARLARLRPLRALAAPGLVLLAIGAGMLFVARTQPFWVNGQVGPGLMAQLASAAVMLLGALWACIRAAGPVPTRAQASCQQSPGAPVPSRAVAPAVLGAVLVFALALPLAGLVLSAGLAAGVAAWGAGERSPGAMAATMLGIMALIAAIGMALLPPTAPLWPSV